MALSNGVYRPDDSWAYYLVMDGYVMPLTSREQFEATGFTDDQVMAVPAEEIAKMPVWKGFEEEVETGIGEGMEETTGGRTETDLAGNFNEAGYLAANKDVAEAVAAGFFRNGKDHWDQIGHAEGRSFGAPAGGGEGDGGNTGDGGDDSSTGGNTDGNTFNFDPSWFTSGAFDLDQYTGPLSAPITEGMFSALQGIKNTTNADPIGMSKDVASSISKMLSGDGFAGAGWEPNQVMAKFRPPVNGLAEATKDGFQTMSSYKPSDLSGFMNNVNNFRTPGQDLFTDTSGVQNGINNIRANQPKTSDLSGFFNSLGGVKSNDPGVSDFGGLFSSMNSIRGNRPASDFGGYDSWMGGVKAADPGVSDFSNLSRSIGGIRNNRPTSDFSGLDRAVSDIKAANPGVSDFSRLNRTMDRIGSDIAPTNTGRSDAVLNSILTGGANANVDPRTRGFQNNLLSSFNTALSAPRFDNTQLFNDLRTVFEGDLADQTAELQEQFSGLGLGPGSTDRLNKIASNAGNARARFGVGMGDIASRSFESAEARRLGAINSAGGVNEVLQTGTRNALSALNSIMANERLPFEEKIRQRDQLIATLPAEIQAAVIPVEQRQQNRAQDISILPIEMQRALAPFAQQMELRGQDISMLPIEMQMALAPVEQRQQNRAQNIAIGNMEMDRARIPFEQALQLRGQDISMLPLEMQAALAPIEQRLQKRGQDISMLPTELQAAQIPFAENMDIQQLLASLLPMEMANSQIPFAQKMAVRDQFLQTLPFEMEAATRPFEESMEFARSVLDPAAARRLQGVAIDSDMANSAMNRYMQEREMANRARETGVNASIATRGQDIDQRGQQMQANNNLFNAESLLRSAADDEAMRAYQEFTRTQGGVLQQMLGFLNMLPEGTVAVGPSQASQWGTVAGQVVSNFKELLDAGKIAWDVGKKIYDWVR